MALATTGVVVPAVRNASPAGASDYSSLVVADGAESYWRLAQTNTDFADELDNAGGTFSGNPVGGRPGAIAGDPNPSTYFDGDTVAYPAEINHPLFTVEAWFNVAPGTTGTRLIYSYGGYGVALGLQDGKPFGEAWSYSELTWWLPPQLHTTKASTSFADGNWHHVALTHDAGTLLLYVDGGLVGYSMMLLPAYWPAQQDRLVGARDPWGGFFLGHLDEMAVYQYALSQPQLQDHYVAAGYELKPVAGEIDPEEVLGDCNRGGQLIAKTQGMAADPVNTATGNFSTSARDLAVPGRGFSLDFTRTYNSLLAGTNGPLGYGWSHSYAMSLSFTGDDVTVHQENGCQIEFTKAGGGYSAPPRVTASLTKNGDGTYTLVRSATQRSQFSSVGNLLTHTDPNDYVTTLGYNASGQLETVRDADNRHTLTFAYENGRVKTVTDDASPSRQVVFGYDAAGDLRSVTDVAGGVTSYTYEAGTHRLLTMLDPNQADAQSPVPVTNHYDAEGRVDWQTDRLGRRTAFDYTTVAGSTKVTGPSAPSGPAPGDPVTLHTYTHGLLTSVTRGYGTTQASTWQFSYDPATLAPLSVTDPNGHTTTFFHDHRGNLLSATDPLGREVTAHHNAFDQPLAVTEAEGVTTSFVYDAKGNLVFQRRPLLRPDGSVEYTQELEYRYGERQGSGNSRGDLTTVVDPADKTWLIDYNADGYVTKLSDPATPTRRLTTFEPDHVGRVLGKVSPKGNIAPADPEAYRTHVTYEPDGLVGTVIDPLDHEVAEVHYDDNRNVDFARDANDALTDFVYNAADELVTVVRPDGSDVHTTYRPDGQVETTTDGDGNTTAYGYDVQGRLTTVTDPLLRQRTHGYDPAGNVVSVADPGGTCPPWPIAYPPALGATDACTVYRYDEADQVVAVYYSDPATPDVANVDYDDNSRRVAMTDGTGTSTWAFDSLGRLTASTSGGGLPAGAQSVGYGYDNRDNLTSITYSGGFGVSRRFNDVGQMDQVSWASQVAGFSYDANGNLEYRTLPNGVVDHLLYDRADRPQASTTAEGAVTVATLSYGRDPTGALASVDATGLPAADHTYAYDDLNRLCVAAPGTAPAGTCEAPAPGSDTWGHDAADNLAALPWEATQAFDDANQLTSSRGTPAATQFGVQGDVPVPGDYDASGNAEVAVFRPSSATWDVRGLSAVVWGGSSDTPVPADYDGDGRDDIAVFRPSNGTWYVRGISDTAYGTQGDIPVPADYDGDGETDLAIFRPSVALWAIHRSSDDTDVFVTYGIGSDIPVPDDYDGDGKADIAIFRPGSATWWVRHSSTGADVPTTFGIATDTPVPADYDGDARADIAVFRDGTWFHLPSSGGSYVATVHGGAGDLAVPADYDGDGIDDPAVFRPGTVAWWYKKASGATTFTYDSRGNRTVADPEIGPTESFAYDQADRLTSAPGGATYTYAGDGLRQAKAISGTPTTFAWDQASGLPELLDQTTAGPTTETTRFVYGPGGLPLAQVGPAATHYLHSDQLGSTRMLTEADGDVAATFTYDPYGTLAASTNPGGVSTPLRFAGEYSDDETGLQYLRARYYDPATAQFLTRDPLEAATGSAYGYVGGDPLNFVDPSGLVLDEVSDFFAGFSHTATGGYATPFLGGGVDVCSDAFGAGQMLGAAAPIAGASRLGMRRPIHSRYADGTPVFKGQQPPRLGTATPDPAAVGPHARLRWDSENARVYQAREFDELGKPVRDIDFTGPTFPNGTLRPGHSIPEQHSWLVNDPEIGPKSGYRRGPGAPL